MNAEETAELARQYSRIGYEKGEAWPTSTLAPVALLSLLRTVPDDGGRAGYIEALRQVPRQPWYRRWL